MNNRRNNTGRVLRWLAFLSVMVLAVSIGMESMAAGRILLRSFDLSDLGNGSISVTVTSDEPLNVGEMSVIVGGIPLAPKTMVESAQPEDCLYVLVVDVTAPYYTELAVRKKGHVNAIIEAARQVINAANPKANFVLIWAESGARDTGVVDRAAALQELENQQAHMLDNYQHKRKDGNLNGAVELALGMVKNNWTMVTSVFVFSDFSEDIGEIGSSFIEQGATLSAWAIFHSTYKKQGNAEAGRKRAETETIKAGGEYEEWDIAAYRSNGEEYQHLGLGRLTSGIRNLDSRTKRYTYTFPEESLEQARASLDQKLVIAYGGAAQVERVIPDLQLSQLPTPVPTETITPTATPKVIYFGNEEPEVLELQQILQQKGYYTGELTGVYDAETRKALQKIWQENEGTDQEASFEAWSIELLDRLPKYADLVTPAPETMDLHSGDQGYYVEKLQDKLYQLGYFHRLKRNGQVFDPDTQEAVRRFCLQNGLAVQEDGCSASLFSRILAADDNAKYIQPDFVLLRLGERDETGDKYIEKLQTELQQKGYLPSGYQLGVLDENTMEAVRKMAREYKWEIPEDSLSVELQQRIRTTDPSAKAEVIALHLNDTGEYVIKLQNQLSNLGYFFRLKVNGGVFDQDTQEAVWRFCDQVRQTRPEGGCPEELFRMILGSTIAFKAPEMVPLALNDTDAENEHYVQNLQANLLEKFYLEPGYRSGTLDEKTMEAVRKVCRDNGWEEPDQEISLELIQRIFTAKVAVTPTPAPNYRTLVLGEEDAPGEDYIARMQDRLNELGYFEDSKPKNGSFDETTAKALALFMEQNRINGDGRSITAAQLESRLFGEKLERRQSVSEKFVQTVTDDVDIMGKSFPMWIILSIVGLLLLAIIVVLVLTATSRKKPETDPSTPSANVRKAQPNQAPVGSGTPQKALRTGKDHTTQNNADNGNGPAPRHANPGRTAGRGGQILRFTVTYGDKTWTESIPLTERILIGRNVQEGNLTLDSSDLSASRVHCELVENGGSVIVRNLSAKKPIYVNGNQISENGFSRDGATVGLEGMAFGQEESRLNNGDVLTVGNHRIQVNF